MDTVEQAHQVQLASSRYAQDVRVRSGAGIRYTPFLDEGLRNSNFDVVKHSAVDVMHNICAGSIRLS
jgi:hypothetical protein